MYNFFQEREKFIFESNKWQKEGEEMQSLLLEESSAKLKLQMELDCRDAEIEMLQSKIQELCQAETASLSSADCDPSSPDDTSLSIHSSIQTQGFFMKFLLEYVLFV